MRTQTIDWNAVEAEQQRIIRMGLAQGMPLTVSDWRRQFRSHLLGGESREKTRLALLAIYGPHDEATSTGVAYGTTELRAGSLTREYVLALFEEEWPDR
jgi:hypothetical protein